VVTDAERLAAYQGAFPSRKECRRYDIYHKYCGKKRLSPLDRENIIKEREKIMEDKIKKFTFIFKNRLNAPILMLP
jgi:hypothetical protein